MKRSLERDTSVISEEESDNKKLALSVLSRPTQTAKMQLMPITKFDSQFPFFREPSEVGTFSQDYERKFHLDKRQLKFKVDYPNNANLSFNLRHGYKQMIKRDDSKLEYIDHMLKWIMEEPKVFLIPKSTPEITHDSIQLSSLNTDFVCWRGLMTSFLCTPYENTNGWKIAVIRFRGTYFLCDFPTEEKKQRLAKTTEREDEMCYWGWKFEQYVTSDSRNGKPDTAKPVNNNEGFCSVVRTRLNSHSIVYGGEVDAIDEKIEGSNKYIEYKTTRQITHPKQDINFKRFKLIKWWAQSFLVGISQIICGYRDDNGIVHRLEEFPTNKIPEIVKDIRNPWKPNVCFNFLDQVLSFIKSSITVNDCNTVFLVEWSPNTDITINKSNESEYKFLPQWFINWDKWDDGTS